MTNSSGFASRYFWGPSPLVELSPLRGVRFNSEQTGPIGPLLAPPYDVPRITVDGAEHSISRIENAELAVAGDQHKHAARLYRDWLAKGVLARDSAPAFYIHRHHFSVDGARVLRTGLIARVRLCDWNDRIVLPHEKTMDGPRAERRDRLRAVNANLSPLYLLFRDADGEVGDLLESAWAPESTRDEHDRMGGAHQLDVITDSAFHHRVRSLFARRLLFVADGHHRYEAALEYRNEQRRLHPGMDGPWEYVLALLAAVEDPGVQVWPTHRVLRGDPPVSASLLSEVLNRWFKTQPIDTARADDIDRAIFRVVLPGSRKPTIVSALPGNPHLDLVPRNRSAAWRSLGVAAVEGVLEAVLGSRATGDGIQVSPIVTEQAAIHQVLDEAASAAFLLPAPSLDQLLTVAEQGDLLPSKSTWFEPKAPAGLVINDLRLSAP